MTSTSTSAERRPLLATTRHTFSHDFDADPVYSCIANPHAHLPVYTNIHRIRRDIVAVVEDYLSPEQLRDMRINVSVIRPLVDKLYDLDDISIVYCLLVNRAQFLHEQAGNKNRQNVNFTRAALCELIAQRILRRFNEDNEGLEGLLVLSHILVAGFEPFQNAPESVRQEAALDETWLYSRTLPALEVAILSESKFLLSSTACQKVINAIYEGRVIYTPSSFLNMIPDRYKQKPISLYDPRNASLLDQYRLIVPRTRNVLEALQFVVLLGLYVAFMLERDASRYSGIEIAFAIFSFGWVIDQFATILEHGWHVYTQNLWSFLDVIYAVVFWAYLVLRLHGYCTSSPLGSGQQALDVLAMAAPVLIPRIAFTVMSDNLLFVSLRSMVADFTLLTVLAFWCFAGFLLSLAWLGEGQHPIATISKWMVYIWFGLDGTGIQRSAEFHWLLGPSLMVAFAFLGNTLFLTILVSMLSNTFSTIVSNATAEILFRRAVLTLEGVKSDAIFAYQPPFNILALFILVPLKFFVSPRWFHKIHVACVRTINLPVLLIIALFERRLLWPADVDADANKTSRLQRRHRLRRSFWDGWRITAHGDIFDVFDLPPPDSVEEEIAVDDDLTHHLIRRQFVRPAPTPPPPPLAQPGLEPEPELEPDRESRPLSSIQAMAEAATMAATALVRATAKREGDAPGEPSVPSVPNVPSTVKNVSDLSASTNWSDSKQSTVKFSGSAAQSAAPSLRSVQRQKHHNHILSRRDSIILPGLDADKLWQLLADGASDDVIASAGAGAGSGSGAGVDGDHGADDGDSKVHPHRARRPIGSRLDALEQSVARIESLLCRLVGNEDDDTAGSGDSDERDDRGESVGNIDDSMASLERRAHEVADEVVDDGELSTVEQTGTMDDLDQSMDSC